MRTPRRLRAGVASALLPIYPGLNLSGYAARRNPAMGQHDDLWIHALAIESNGHVQLLISVDVLGFSLEDAAEIRERIIWRLERPDITVGVLLAGTHSHSAPASMNLRGCGEVNEKWFGEVRRRIVTTAVDASSRLQPARIGAGVGQVEGVSLNRRAVGGPLDTEIGVLKVETHDGEPLACLLNFACHPVVMDADNVEASAEYPGRVGEILDAALGVPTLFFNGAAGDINPCDRGTWDDVEHLAQRVASEALDVWERTETKTEVHIGAESKIVSLPMNLLSEEMSAVNAYLDASALSPTSWSSVPVPHADLVRAQVDFAYRSWAQQVTQLYHRHTDPKTHDETTLFLKIELQVVQLGDLLLAAVPGELFVALGLQIKSDLHADEEEPVWVLGYANGNLGYIPSREAYAFGGYEVETAHRFYGQPCCVAPETGEMLVETLVELGSALKGRVLSLAR